MKALTLVLAIAFLVFLVGCEDASIRRTAGNPVEVTTPGKPATTNTLQINERVEVSTPDGFKGFADVTGQVEYTIIESASKAMAKGLKKELPVKPMYTINLSVKGEIAPLFLEKAAQSQKLAQLAKPNVWTFNGSETRLVEEGGDLEAIFQIEGSKYHVAHLRILFLFTRSQVVAPEYFIDLRAAADE